MQERDTQNDILSHTAPRTSRRHRVDIARQGEVSIGTFVDLPPTPAPQRSAASCTTIDRPNTTNALLRKPTPPRQTGKEEQTAHPKSTRIPPKSCHRERNKNRAGNGPALRITPLTQRHFPPNIIRRAKIVHQPGLSISRQKHQLAPERGHRPTGPALLLEKGWVVSADRITTAQRIPFLVRLKAPGGRYP